MTLIWPCVNAVEQLGMPEANTFIIFITGVICGAYFMKIRIKYHLIKMAKKANNGKIPDWIWDD